MSAGASSLELGGCEIVQECPGNFELNVRRYRYGAGIPPEWRQEEGPETSDD